MEGLFLVLCAITGVGRLGFVFAPLSVNGQAPTNLPNWPRRFPFRV